MLALDYLFAGLALGAVAALSGVGMLVTYRATGVFNMAHGAVAMLAAYLYWQLTDPWGVVSDVKRSRPSYERVMVPSIESSASVTRFPSSYV